MIWLVPLVLLASASNNSPCHHNIIPSLMHLTCRGDLGLLLRIRPDSKDSINSFDKALDVLACFCVKHLADYKSDTLITEELTSLIYAENNYFNSLLKANVFKSDGVNLTLWINQEDWEFDIDSLAGILFGDLGIFVLFIQYSKKPIITQLLSKMNLKGPLKVFQVVSNFRYLRGIPHCPYLALFILKCFLGQEISMQSDFFGDKYLHFFKHIERFVLRVTDIPLPETWFFDPISILKNIQLDPPEDISHQINEDYMMLNLRDLIIAPKSVSTAIFYLGVILYKYISHQLKSRDLNTLFHFNPYSRYIGQNDFSNKFLTMVINEMRFQDKNSTIKRILDDILLLDTYLDEERSHPQNIPVKLALQVMRAIKCINDRSFGISSVPTIINLMRFSEFEPVFGILFDHIIVDSPEISDLKVLLNICLTAAPDRSFQLVSFPYLSHLNMANNETLLKIKLLRPDSFEGFFSNFEGHPPYRAFSLRNYVNILKLPTLKSKSETVTSECFFYSNYDFYLTFEDIYPKIYITSENILLNDGSVQVYNQNSSGIIIGSSMEVRPGDTVYIFKNCLRDPGQFYKHLKYSSPGIIIEFLSAFEGYGFNIISR
jgi:hypothetical protein